MNHARNRSNAVLRCDGLVALLLWLAAGAALGDADGGRSAPQHPDGRLGPLVVGADNPRYFACPDGQPVYLAGAHDGWELQDFGWGDTVKEKPFDWVAFLKFLSEHHHNVIRLWCVAHNDSERTLPQRHPVGITVPCGGAKRARLNPELFASHADWVSPNRESGRGFNYRDNPPPADGRKVVLLDSDHLHGNKLQDRRWGWKAFCRGHNVLFMDRWTEAPDDPLRQQVRRVLGQTVAFSRKLDLAKTVPDVKAASTGFCLVNAGRQYLAYQPGSGPFQLDLSRETGDFAVTWFNPTTEAEAAGGRVAGGAVRTFRPPFEGDAVLFIQAAVPAGGKSTVPQPAQAGPQPGDVFREYTWAKPEGDAGGSLRVGGKLGYGGGPLELPHAFDLEYATRAEVVIEKLLCHDGTRGLALSVNGREWIPMPEAAGIPQPQWEYQHFTFPTAAIPLAHLKAGPGNTFALRVSDEHPWHWPQHLVYGAHFRVYYDAAKKPHPTGSVLFPKPGGNLGRKAELSANVASPNRRVRRVDFLAFYDGVNWEGDGLYRQWHYHYFQGRLTNHVGTAFAAPWRVPWDTSWVPDQTEPMQLAARVTDETGLTTITRAVGGITLKRPGLSVELCKPYDVPVKWVTRSGEKAEKFRVSGDPRNATAAQLVWSSWSPGYMNGLFINERKVFETEGPRYACFSHRVPLADLSGLQAGENILKTGPTPKRNGKMVHGMEVNWPGVMVLIQYQTRP